MNSNARNLEVTFLHEETIGKIMSPVGRDKLPIHRESSWKLACSCRRWSPGTRLPVNHRFKFTYKMPSSLFYYAPW